jgi:hypothetical protein
MIEFFAENGVHLLAAYGALVALATAIVKITPTTKDNAILDKILGVLDYFSTALRK